MPCVIQMKDGAAIHSLCNLSAHLHVEVQTDVQFAMHTGLVLCIFRNDPCLAYGLPYGSRPVKPIGIAALQRGAQPALHLQPCCGHRASQQSRTSSSAAHQLGIHKPQCIHAWRVAVTVRANLT